MHASTRMIHAFAVGAAVLALLATEAAAAVATPDGSPQAASSARKPQRKAGRATSLDWMSDVRERLRILEAHSAESALTHMQPALEIGPLGQPYPRLPAVGDGARP